MKLPIFVVCDGDPQSFESCADLNDLSFSIEVYDAQNSQSWYADGQVIDLRVETKKFLFFEIERKLSPIPTDRYDVDGLKNALTSFLEYVDEPIEKSANLDELLECYFKFDKEFDDDDDDKSDGEGKI